MLLEVIIVGLACISVHAFVIFEDCGSAYDLQAVSIAGCGWSLPCHVTLGQDVPVTLHFVADFTSVLLNQDVVFNLNHVNLQTRVTPEPCATVSCPLPMSIDRVTSFTSIMSVPRNMALNQRGWLRWRVFNERGLLVLCYSVLIQTQNSVQKLLRQIPTSSLQ